MAANPDDKNLALYCDFENIALGVRDAKYQKFNIDHVLERLLVKGSIVVKKAYCDWQRYKDFKASMHEAAFELIDIPHVRQSGKNSADIRMVVDALDLCYTKSHVDTFVIISGDSDFSPLVSKLRENAKTVIGVGVKNSTSDLLISNCDEFIYYDDLVREREKKPSKRRSKKRSGARRGRRGAAETTESVGVDNSVGANVDASTESSVPEGTEAGTGSGQAADKSRVTSPDSADGASEEAGIVEFAERGEAAVDDDELALEGIELVVETARALGAERDKVWGSMIKQTLKRRRPGFNESYYGFDSFGALLEEAAEQGMLILEADDRSGGYIVREVSD